MKYECVLGTHTHAHTHVYAGPCQRLITHAAAHPSPPARLRFASVRLLCGSLRPWQVRKSLNAHKHTHTHSERVAHTDLYTLALCVCVCVCLSHFRFDFTHDSLARPTSSSGKHLCLVSYANPFELRHKSSASVHATETAWTAPDSFTIGYQTGWEKEELTHKQPKSFAFVLLSGEQRCNLLGFVVAAMPKQKQ